MSFTLESYRRLKKYLGEYDALIEISELSIREFIEKASESNNISDYIDAASERHKIRVNFFDLSSLSTKIAQNYIVSVYQSADLFFNEFKSEVETISSLKWKIRDSKKSLFDYTFENLPGSFENRIETVGIENISTFKYYHTVRTRITHPHTVSGERILRDFENAEKYKNELELRYKINKAPNKFDEITFDDFILFSRLLKKTAYSFCQLAKPDLEIIKQSIELKDFNKFSNDPKRLRNAISGQLRTLYGIDIEEANLIASEILAH